MALAVVTAVALTATSAHAQNFPRRTLGGTVGLGPSGVGAVIFGEADRGHWRAHGRIAAISYSVGCKESSNPARTIVPRSWRLWAQVFSRAQFRNASEYSPGMLGIARYNVGLDGHAEY